MLVRVNVAALLKQFHHDHVSRIESFAVFRADQQAVCRRHAGNDAGGSREGGGLIQRAQCVAAVGRCLRKRRQTNAQVVAAALCSCYGARQARRNAGGNFLLCLALKVVEQGQ